MPITCESGFSNYWPPFLGNVRIKNFRLSKDTAKAYEEVHALGKTEVKKWTPWNDWGPLTDQKVNIIWAWAGAEKVVAASGKPNGHGNFDIEFTSPFVTLERTVGLWASLPEPSGGYPEDHLECGPLELRALPGKKKPEDEKTKRLAAYTALGVATGVGVPWLMTR